MKNLAVAIAFAALLAAPAPAQQAPGAADTIGVDEIRPGMTGYGLTVVKGTEPERFEVEVIGVLRNIAPRRDGIIVRVAGLDMEKSGIIGGMSGSPVYLEGRLAGAVAFGWTWSKEPIGGVTPIGEMEAAFAAPPMAVEPAASWRTFDILRILGRGEPRLPVGRDAGETGRTGLSSIALPLAIPALTGQARRIAESLFPPERFVLAEGVVAASSADDAGAASLQPGSSVFAALVTGDMTVGAIGTVTDVRGREVYAFGHPFLNEDDVRVPMYTSRVLTVFPSSQRSFKLASPAEEVGAFVRDRSTGVMGIVGEKGRMVPMTVTVRHGDAKSAYHYNVIEHYSLTPQMAAMAAAASVTALGDLPPGATLSYGFDVSFRGDRKLETRWTSSGPGALSVMAKDVSSQLSVAMLNPVEKLKPTGINLDVDVKGTDTTAVIDSAAVLDNEVGPGETLRIRVTLRPVFSEPVTVRLEITVPPDTTAGPRALIVCDGRMSDILDLEELRHRLRPKTAEEILEVITPKRAPGEIVARLAAVNFGLAIDGHEMPRLPSSTLSILAAPQESALSPVLESAKEWIETPYVLTGKVVIPVQIKPLAEEK